MISRNELKIHLHDLLNVDAFKDYAPNGLQVEGKSELKKIVTGVSATQALIDHAVNVKADAIIVHHGWFWKNEDPAIVGMKKNRLAQLLKNDISLFGYHLPLDAHPELGNNAQLAKSLDINVESAIDEQGVGNYGRFDQYYSLDDIAARVETVLIRKPTVVTAGDHAIRKVAWCTGGAQSYIEKVAKFGVDLFISGEISEQTTHFARENGVHYIAAGHHATERYGVKALGEYIASQFALIHEFVDIDNPA